ncbi:hypothetical protein QTQ03_15475 [Micromonospora sp. WMMA1363]|nr:hypothetical protein [Micromonospora sp. WMMA1363]MDM4720924.1 hypothetical protein [Micromonospora sp. WMMA1363]
MPTTVRKSINFLGQLHKRRVCKIARASWMGLRCTTVLVCFSVPA